MMNEEPELEQKETKIDRLEERLLKTRTILIYGEINQKLAKTVSEKLLILTAESKKDIRIFINSQGGHVESGDTIFDMIRFCKAPLKMIGTGWVASAATLIYLAVPLKNRFCLPNTRFLIHQPLGGMIGTAVDLAIEAKEIVRMKRRLNDIISKQTGQKLEKVEKDTERNFWMSAEEALDYGIVGAIIKSESEV
jgi:ATP-dependent Clp protease protease subunit